MQSHMRKEPVMSKVRFIGLDVHADTITVAVAEPGGEVRSLGIIPNQAAAMHHPSGADGIIVAGIPRNLVPLLRQNREQPGDNVLCLLPKAQRLLNRTRTLVDHAV